MASTPLQFIAELVTPAVMISSSGLLLLGLQSKYSNIVSRIRNLIEKRSAVVEEEENHSGIANLTEQIRFLMRRAWCARNAIFCLYVSILFMIATSICYAMALAGILSSGKVAVAMFICGILVLFVGAVFALVEVQFAYRVITLEVERNEIFPPEKNLPGV